MREVIKATALGQGITADSQPLELHQQVEFTDPTSFELTDHETRLLLEAFDKGNAVEVICWDQPTGVFYPLSLSKPPDVRWTSIFGRDPNKEIVHTFGEPEAVLRAEYLGHRDRDVVIPLMEEQETEFNQQAGAEFEPYESGYRRRIVLTSPAIVEANLYGLGGWPSETQRPEDGFPGKAMFMVRVDRFPKEIKLRPDVNLSIATLSKHNPRLRIEGWREDRIKIFDLDADLNPLFTRLAEISLFTQELHNENITNQKPYHWFKKGLPLQICYGLNTYLEEAIRSSHPGFMRDWEKALQNRYDFNWREIIKTLSSRMVKEETQRIKDLFAHILKL